LSIPAHHSRGGLLCGPGCLVLAARIVIGVPRLLAAGSGSWAGTLFRGGRRRPTSGCSWARQLRRTA